MLVQKYRDMLKQKSVIRQLSEFATARGKEIGYENVFDYSLGNPSVPVPKEFTDTMIHMLSTRESNELHGYSPNPGITSVREAVAASLEKRFGLPYRKEHIFMASGAAGALAHAFRLVTEPGDEILTFAPFFPEYHPYVDLTGAVLKVVPPETESFQIHFEELEKALNPHTKGVIINSPNNPSGAVYSEETIQKLADLLRRKSGEFGTEIFILADEPYREIVYDGVKVPFVTKYYRNTLVCYSYSKSLSLPGERIGYVLVPDEVVESTAVYAAVAGAGRALGYVCAPSMFQKVLVQCMGQTGDVELYKKNRDLLYEGLTKIGYECFKPQGAFYLFVKALEPDADAFCEKAKEEDLLIVSATGFGCPGYARISYCVDEDMIRRSFGAFERLYNRYEH